MIVDLVCGDMIGAGEQKEYSYRERNDPQRFDRIGGNAYDEFKYAYGFRADFVKKGYSGSPIVVFDFMIRDTLFTVAHLFLGHRGSRGDVDTIMVWRNDEILYSPGVLIEVGDVRLYYDRYRDVLYIYHQSDYGADEGSYHSVTTVEDPLGCAICNTFHQIRKV